jgi:4-hydroxy-tetrahydrodipicolinate synthase
MDKSNYVFPTGVHTVLVTPFNEFPNKTSSVDYDSMETWFAMQANSGVAGLVLLGSTSESSTLKESEKMEIVKKIHNWNMTLQTPKFITVGVGGNNTYENLKFAKKCVGYCNAFMVTVPHYNKPTQDGIYEHFKYICNNEHISSFPVIMYNIPGRTCIDMEARTMVRVFNDCANVVAVKEASGSCERAIELRNMEPQLKVFSGDDSLITEMTMIGGVGVISVASNIIPDIMAELYDYCKKKDYQSVTSLMDTYCLRNFFSFLFCEPNPTVPKFMLYEMCVFSEYAMRLPLLPLTEQNRHKADETLLATTRPQLKKLNTING